MDGTRAEMLVRRLQHNDYLAERCGQAPSLCRIIDRPRYLDDRPDHQTPTPVMQAVLSMVVWILKREVRAIGGCLGIHRR